MSSAAIMDALVSKIRMVLSEAEEVLPSDVTPQQAEEVNRLLGEAMSAVCLQVGEEIERLRRHGGRWRFQRTIGGQAGHANKRQAQRQ
jgi:precorrin-2 methylase